MKKYVKVNYKPRFDPKCINECKFSENERFKECVAFIKSNKGYVEWLTQASRHPSRKFSAEIARAFIANGLKSESIVHVKYGVRDDGLDYDYDIIV